MTREGTLIMLGILVAVLPFIGLPLSLLHWLIPIVGLLISVVGLSLRKKRLMQSAEQTEAEQHIHTEAKPSPFHQVNHEYQSVSHV